MKESMCSRWHLRLIVLLILFFPLTLSAAQGRVTVKGQSITLRQAIKIIESSSNFKFFFNPSDLDALPGKNLDCEGEISDVLKEVFAGSGISYVIMGDDIILKLEKKAASTQQKKVEIVGGVVDARSGESVVGATVRVKDVNSGVITDMDGKFTIKATPGDVLVISYIGYETKEVKVVNGKVLLVELVEDAKQLEEVVVTAYGSGQKKASMVGSYRQSARRNCRFLRLLFPILLPDDWLVLLLFSVPDNRERMDRIFIFAVFLLLAGVQHRLYYWTM